MNGSFSAQRLASLALALLLCSGLTACRSSSEMAGGEGDAPQVSTRGTIDVLEQGLTNISVDAAVQNINGWEARLSETDGDSFSDIIDNLGALEQELQSGSIDAASTAQLLGDLGQQTSDAASMASGQAADNVRALGEALSAGASSLQ